MSNIFNLSKKLLESNKLIEQLETENRLLQQQKALQAEGEESKYRQRKRALLRPVQEMAEFVSREFEFRHNVVRDSYEYRRRNRSRSAGDVGTDSAQAVNGGAQTVDAGGWLPVNERQMNTILNSVQDEGEVFCLKSLVQQRIRSEMARDYHPVAAWLADVRGTWDGSDRIGELAARINSSDYCRQMMTIWLRAVVAQWLGIDERHANAVMLLLVSEQQGLHKSTFCHALLPDELESYYTDDFTLQSKSNAERKLVEFALVNIDEFDKLPQKKMPDLKTLMQTLRPSFVKAYKTNFNQLPRIASFVGTSNSRQLLSDRSGSRRFLILEPQGVINVEGIDHRQLYAQLVSEVEAGERYYFTKAEEQAMNRMNQQYYKPTPLEELFTRFFRAANTEADDKTHAEGLWLTASQLMNQLSRRAPGLMRTVSVTAFGQTMNRLGIPREHRHDGNYYHVAAL